ncbi:hypothetical protein [Bacillus sp. FSL R9-9410]|uniref:hypothetical protein n=1 Tax=Bacillus sp. FSL R9-9410 TaxID=2921590 RepID=UPI0031013DBE
MGKKYCSSDYDYYKEKYYSLKDKKECNSYREHKCCEKKSCASLCDCKGVVNNFVTPTNRFLVNICPNCKEKGSSVFAQLNNLILQSTSVCLPKCINIVGVGIALTASGLGSLTVNGNYSEGSFTVLLFERFGADDSAILSFSGINAAGVSTGTVIFFFTIPDANLSITKCNSHGCICNQSGTESVPFINSSETSDKNKAVVYYSDGTVEEIEG